MSKTKIYANGNVKQKAYRERKKKLGNRNVLVLVPEYLFLFIKGEPSKLKDSFIAQHKDQYIDFDDLDFSAENGVTYAILRNHDGVEWKVTNPDQIKTLQRFHGKARLYVDGRLVVMP